ncbi:hypothetical protein QVN42_13245 [Yersinia nurmii]|uniref:Lipoprotein n=1 Tax=Yersinia nurmii TaxID=685706 RepID=A0AAW7K4V8_9GAMM|nr:hypothetical protein [Yersinia nurmii]MDN0088330.1 hypothetical protein [Yersinia nurmii]CNF28726.1 Uncharacterised protein [Yersinia nurmii]
MLIKIMMILLVSSSYAVASEMIVSKEKTKQCTIFASDSFKGLEADYAKEIKLQNKEIYKKNDKVQNGSTGSYVVPAPEYISPPDKRMDAVNLFSSICQAAAAASEQGYPKDVLQDAVLGRAYKDFPNSTYSWLKPVFIQMVDKGYSLEK